MYETLFFREIGFIPDEYSITSLKANAFQLAGDYLMDGKYADYNEHDVITWEDASIDWVAETVIIPVRQVYQPWIC